MKSIASKYPGSLASYTIGFILSIILTLMAYVVVVYGILPDYAKLLVMALAAAQMVIQLVFFLHLGNESSPKWNLAAFAFMLLMLGILVIGSLWIMNNLNYNMMMSPQEMNQYMLEQNKKGF